MQLIYTMFITSPFFSLVVKGESAKISKSLNILWTWLSEMFSFTFYVFINSLNW